MYAIALTAGVLSGGVWLLLQPDASKAANRLTLSLSALMEGYLAICISALVGSRIGYLLAHRRLTIAAQLHTVVGSGGLSWGGAVFGGSLALLTFSRLSRASFFRICQRLTIPMLLVHLAVRIGILLTPISDASAQVPPSVDVHIDHELLELLAVLASVLLLAGIRSLMARQPVAGLALGGAALIQLLITLTSTTPVQLIGRLRLDTSAALVAMVIAFGVQLFAPALSEKKPRAPS